MYSFAGISNAFRARPPHFWHFAWWRSALLEFLICIFVYIYIRSWTIVVVGHILMNQAAHHFLKKKAINPLTVPIMFTLAYCKPIHYSDKTKKAIYIFGQMHIAHWSTLIHTFSLALQAALSPFTFEVVLNFPLGQLFIYIYIYIYIYLIGTFQIF